MSSIRCLTLESGELPSSQDSLCISYIFTSFISLGPIVVGFEKKVKEEDEKDKETCYILPEKSSAGRIEKKRWKKNNRIIPFSSRTSFFLAQST